MLEKITKLWPSYAKLIIVFENLLKPNSSRAAFFEYVKTTCMNLKRILKAAYDM
jgi:hypothetical protein